MPYRICKTFEIESGHMLSKHPANCKFPHGHSRTVELVLSADTLDDHEMVCDYKVLKTLLADFLDTLDHAMCMNTDDPQFEAMQTQYGARVVAFQNEDPTTEVLARSIYEFCREALANYASTNGGAYHLRDAVALERVRVSETSSSWAEYCA